MNLVSIDEYCTINYYTDIYGYRNANEMCTTTETSYNPYYGHSSEVFYDSYSFLAPYDDVYSTDEYCTWDYYGTETCTTTTVHLNGDTYTDTKVYH